MNSHQNLQTLFSNVIQAILTKIALDYNLSISEVTNKIGVPTITDDLESSIQSYCNALVPPIQNQSIPEKTKKIVKKKVPVTDTVVAVADTIAVETVIEKPKRVLKKKVPSMTDFIEINIASPTDITEKIASPIIGDTIVSAIAQAIVMPDKPKKVLKKKASVIETAEAAVPAETETIVAIADKPKKVLKKAVVETAEAAVPAETETIVAIADKPKKVLKKKAVPLETETVIAVADTVAIADTVIAVVEKLPQILNTPIVKEIDTLELEELKLKPKKIMLKKPVLESKKNVDQPEYGEDVEQAEPYESLEMYEDDSLEPKEFNGVKYYVDTSGYIYDFENQDLVGKLNQSGDSIILLNDFSPMSE
jgi:hypothetical protein